MGELLRAYEAEQELLCRLPSNSSALGVPVRASCPRLRYYAFAGSPTRGYTSLALLKVAGLLSCPVAVNEGTVAWSRFVYGSRYASI